MFPFSKDCKITVIYKDLEHTWNVSRFFPAFKPDTDTREICHK